MKNVDDGNVRSLLSILIDPPDSPPELKILLKYIGSGKYCNTFPFERSRVTMLNNRLMGFKAHIASVEN